MKKRGMIIMMSVLGTVVFAALVLVIVLFTKNEYSIEMNIASGGVAVVEYGDEYELPEAKALFKGSTINTKGKYIEVTRTGEVDLKTLGEYKVEYTASYKKVTQKAVITVQVVDTKGPDITLVSDPEYFTSPIAEYVEEGYSAVDNYDGDVTDRVERFEKDGVVTYTVADSHGNRSTVTRTIVYKDVVAPIITLIGDVELSWPIGTEYVEPGCTAADDCDGDITADVSVEGELDITKAGKYDLTYKVKDKSGNEGTTVRTVYVKDSDPPVITLTDGAVFVVVGESYTEPGFSANDAGDGDVTDKVTVSGEVDTQKQGVYTLTYSVTDISGNTATATRMVYVYDKQSEAVTVDPGNKVVYLTFDDGPGPYTQGLLDVLDKYNVKVTFFVTNQYPGYQYLIAEEAKRGHTVAIHTYSHDYAEIYASEQAYLEDLTKMSDIIESQTGIKPMLFRFPGGSSNLVSANYTKGIMTSLTNNLPAIGYRYFDWNVSSGDAGGTTVTSQVVANVTSGIAAHNVSNVLQHDIKKFSVDAVEEIITWGLANGYTFLPLDVTSPGCHHGVNN